MNFSDVKVKVLATQVEKKNGFSLVFLRDSRHDKKKEVWVRSPYPNVHFAATANAKIDELVSAIDSADKFEDGNSKGVYIILKSVSLTNESYEKDGVKIYPKQLTVWDWDFVDVEASDDNSNESVESSAEELPF